MQTYKPTIKGNQLEWNGEVPEEIKNKENVSVYVTILDEESDSKEFRPFGLSKGEFVVADDFDETLPEEILAGFEGE